MINRFLVNKEMFKTIKKQGQIKEDSEGNATFFGVPVVFPEDIIGYNSVNEPKFLEEAKVK